MRTLLSPKLMANAIGVSESSLRRWADMGKIAMVKTGGGHRRIHVSEAMRFIRETGTPIFRPDILGFSDSEVLVKLAKFRGASPTDGIERITSTLEQVLLDGDAAMARGMLVQLYLENWSLAEIYDGPLRTAMAHIGSLWLDDGAEGIMIEHRATEICYHAIQHLQALQVARGEKAPVAVGGTPSEDRHGLGSLAAASTLREVGYETTNLGADTPTDTLVAAIETRDVFLAWRSIASPIEEAKLAADLSRLAEVMVERGGYLVCGGQHCTATAVPKNPSVLMVGSMRELAAFSKGVLASVEQSQSGDSHRTAG